MDSQWIKPKADAAAPTVVFVHGIMSDGASGWKNTKTGAYWPQLAADELSDAGVYVFSYHSRAFSGRFRVTDAADALWDELKRHGILQSRVIVLVCHSMGGIVARRLLVQRQGELAALGTVIGLFLVASPSAGAQFAAGQHGAPPRRGRATAASAAQGRVLRATLTGFGRGPKSGARFVT